MNAPPEEVRLFVAVELPPPVTAALGELQAELRRRGLSALRWVRPEGIHLTLKFLGEVPARQVTSVLDALASAVQGIGPHDLSLGRLGTFGGRSPRVLWIALEGGVETLGRLQEQVEQRLVALGFPPEERAFSPHLTLARVRPENAREVARPLAAAVPAVNAPPAEIPVREVSLMRSQLKPGGAVYTRLEAFPLTLQ